MVSAAMALELQATLRWESALGAVTVNITCRGESVIKAAVDKLQWQKNVFLLLQADSRVFP